MSQLHLGGARIGLGCMRLSTDADRDEARAEATIAAALEAGVRVFDTARAYGHDDGEAGHNERLLARVGLPADARVVTKGGMRRPRGGWRPDGRARTIRADAEASAEALGRPADVWLLHAPDPGVGFETSLRAMAKVLADGTAQAVGLSNVNRTQLEAALEVIDVAAVQVALGPYADEPLRGGVVELCAARGIPLLAHSPFGGPSKARRIAKDATLRRLAEARGVTPYQIALAWLLDLAEVVVPIAGARRPETARACRPIELDEEARDALRARFVASAFAGPRVPPAYVDGEVVVVMGIPGAGKTHAVGSWTERGYVRLNRDERGGTLAGIAQALDEALSGGAERAVLDNTYLDRASRADVIAVAWRHRIPVRCVWMDTPEDVAQARVCQRLVEQLGALPEPAELTRSKMPGVFGPTRHQRMVRALEPPADSEGFARVEVRTVERAEPRETEALVISLDAEPTSTRPTLMLGWRAGASDAEIDLLRATLPAHVELAVCTHGGGAPSCWCRPPLPGLVVAWARARGIDLRALRFVGGGTSFRRMADALGAAWER